MQLKDGHLLLSPSDVTAYLGCEHLTTLSLQVARCELVKPSLDNEQAELVFRKGREHEAAYLARLRDEGKSVVEISLEPDFDWERAARETVDAMRLGPDVVYQGVLLGEGWRGVADFPMRVETPSELGSWSYEALDTKLARHAKPSYILQLCFYSERVGAIQGVEPALIHVLLGSLEQESFRPDEFAAYYRRVCRRLEEFVADPPQTVAIPCGHCGTCSFKPLCDDHWDAVDHLSRVAGIRSGQIERLGAEGISTLAGLAHAVTRPAGISPETFETLHRQAALQLAARETGVDEFELLPLQAASGFALLPAPSAGDLFFDFEGNPFWDVTGSLEYLWGVSDVNDEFTPDFAWDHDTERQAFERFIDSVHARLREFPNLHVYHYAQYEITALRRMMGRYGTRETELDDLLRRDVFVDLYRVVKGGVRISRPGYGLKEVEHLLGFERDAEIKDGGTSIIEFERWMIERDNTILDGIAAYNREDCIATRKLRDWLLERKAEAIALFGPIPPPEPEEARDERPEKVERDGLRDALLARGDTACVLAGELLAYHDRERKPYWWAMFERLEMTPEALLEDPESIGGLTPAGAPWPLDKSIVYPFTYPAQEQKIGSAPLDAATGKSAGGLLKHDRDQRLLELKRGRSYEDVKLPLALIPGLPYLTNAQEAALVRVGNSLLAGDHKYLAIESILRRDAFDRSIQTNDLDEMTALLLSLDGQHLVIQGPPGSGKTWTSGRLIARLIGAGKRVGVASTSHRAINNLLEEVVSGADEIGLAFRGLKKGSSQNPESEYPGGEIETVFSNDECGDSDVVGGTAWLFSDGQLDSTVDYLFIDEAGQVALADAIAMATCARNVVLIGDPQQLGQVLQGTHPGGSEASVLEHLLDGAATVPADRGIFLEHTFRLHPDVCRFISEEFYESRLQPDAVASTRTTPRGTGLRWTPVEHAGCRQESAAEVEAIRHTIEGLIADGVPASEIKVVAAYNAQVDLLKQTLPDTVEVGTVDKFQGQQSRVVFYSMASSSGEEIPRGLTFLLSRNRFNVAVSRAQCLAYLVCSPRLLEVDCGTIEHMRLANALCRFVELAEIA